MVQWTYQLTNQNWPVCELGTVVLFNRFRFQNLPSHPKSFRAFRETGHWPWWWRAWGPFLESPGNVSGPESCLPCLHLRTVIFKMIQPRPALLFFMFRFKYLISGPKSDQGVWEMGPFRPEMFEKNSNSNKYFCSLFFFLFFFFVFIFFLTFPYLSSFLLANLAC